MLPALCIALATRLATDGVVRVDGVLPAALAADVRTVALAAAVPERATTRGPALAQKRCRGERGRGRGGVSRRPRPGGFVRRRRAALRPVRRDQCTRCADSAAALRLGLRRRSARPLYTCFVALQETSTALGPTEFCLGSHTDADAHAALREGALSREAVPSLSPSARRSSSTRASRTAAARTRRIAAARSCR